MPDRSVKMKRRIFGFQRRVWWPKWTPASSSSRMETTAMVLLPRLVGCCCRRGSGRTGLRGRHRATALGSAGEKGLERRSLAGGRAGSGERGVEVARERRAHLHQGARERVFEGEPGRMEELPPEAELTGPS